MTSPTEAAPADYLLTLPEAMQAALVRIVRAAGGMTPDERIAATILISFSALNMVALEPPDESDVAVGDLCAGICDLLDKLKVA